MESLPKEIIVSEIIPKLYIYDIVSFTTTCKEYRLLSESSILWRVILNQLFISIPDLESLPLWKRSDKELAIKLRSRLIATLNCFGSFFQSESIFGEDIYMIPNLHKKQGLYTSIQISPSSISSSFIDNLVLSCYNYTFYYDKLKYYKEFNPIVIKNSRDLLSIIHENEISLVKVHPTYVLIKLIIDTETIIMIEINLRHFSLFLNYPLIPEFYEEIYLKLDSRITEYEKVKIKKMEELTLEELKVISFYYGGIGLYIKLNEIENRELSLLLIKNEIENRRKIKFQPFFPLSFIYIAQNLKIVFKRSYTMYQLEYLILCSLYNESINKEKLKLLGFSSSILIEILSFINPLYCFESLSINQLVYIILNIEKTNLSKRQIDIKRYSQKNKRFRN